MAKMTTFKKKVGKEQKRHTNEASHKFLTVTTRLQLREKKDEDEKKEEKTLSVLYTIILMIQFYVHIRIVGRTFKSLSGQVVMVFVLLLLCSFLDLACDRLCLYC